MRRAVITLAMGGWYPAGAERMKRTLDETSFAGDFLCWDKMPDGCPHLDQIPFAFKPYCFREALRMGYEQVLWMDASHWAHKSIDPVWKYIGDEGHYMIQDTSWTVGQWCTDPALKAMGVEREEAFGMGMTWAGMIGLDFRSMKSVEWLDRWFQYANDGISFVGPERASDGWCSDDPRVLGHRHDQSAQAVLCARMGMKLEPLHNTFLLVSSDATGRDDVCVLARGGIQGVHW